MTRPLFYSNVTDLNRWFSAHEPSRTHLDLDFGGDPVTVASLLVRLAAGPHGGLGLVRGRANREDGPALTRLVREAEAEVCPGAVVRVEPLPVFGLSAVLVDLRPGALTPTRLLPPERRAALGYALSDLDPEGVAALRAATESAPGHDWPAHLAGQERALVGLGLARVLAGALVPTLAGLLVVGGPGGQPPELLTVRYEPRDEPPRARRLWLPEHIASVEQEGWAWEGLGPLVAGWALVFALTTHALAGPNAARPVRVVRRRRTTQVFVPRDPAPGDADLNPRARGLVEALGLVAAPLTLEGGERLLRARQLGPPALREDEGGVWLMLPHMPGLFVRAASALAPEPPEPPRPPLPARAVPPAPAPEPAPAAPESAPPAPSAPPLVPAAPRPRPAPLRARYVSVREREAAVLDLLQTATVPLSAREIAERLGWAPHRVAAVIYPLADAGRVLRTNPERRASNQRYALAPDSGQAPDDPAPEATP